MPLRKLTEDKQTFLSNDAFSELTARSEFRHVTAALTIDDRRSTLTCETGHGTDPLWPLADVSAGMQLKRPQLRKTRRATSGLERRHWRHVSGGRAAAAAQLPPFAPLLEELEIAGWSSHRQQLSGNFHDWMLLGSDRLLVIVGRTAATGTGRSD